MSSTINGQKASPDIRIPEIDKIETIEDVKNWFRQFRHEWESSHREMWRDSNNVYKVEIPAISEGVVPNFDIPLIEGLNFRISGTTGITWDSGTVTFGGVEYTVTGATVDPATSVYVDVSSLSSPVTLGTFNANEVITSNLWILSNRVGTTVYTVLQSPIIHGGLIQANTITADQIFSSYLVVGTNHTGSVSGNLSGTIQGTASTTVVTGAGLGGTANQDNTSTILGGNHTGTVQGQTIITGGKINTNLVVADSIVAGTITTTELTITSLDGITQQAGTITAGFFGSTDNHLDINNSRLQMRNTGSEPYYVTLSTNGIIFSTGANGGGTVHSQYTKGIVNLRAVSTSTHTFMQFANFGGTVIGNVYQIDANNKTNLSDFFVDSTCVVDASTLSGSIDETAGGTGQTTYSTGDVLYSSSSNNLSKLGIGSNDEVLRSNGSIPVWEKTFATGTYTGNNGSNNQAIGFSSSVIMIKRTSGNVNFAIVDVSSAKTSSGTDVSAVNISGNNLVINTSNGAINATGDTYRWFAWR